MEQSIGAVLAAARRHKGLTIGQLSAITRVREAVLCAMERDDFSLCGGDFYARGHIRAVCKAVDLDPVTVVKLYDEQHGGPPMPVRAAAAFQAERAIKLGERRSGPNWTMALGVALAIVVVFGVVRVMGGTGEVPSTGIQPASVPSPLPTSGAVRPAPHHGEARSTVNEAAGKRHVVVVRMRAKRSSYVNVRDAKGRKLFAGTLSAGKSTTLKAPTGIDVLLGDAGAVSLQVNGRNLGTLGSSGEVVRRSFGPSAPRPR
ncbi:helix-turn-helix domain-containing protein [Thermoactinospora rubra]|uniref:helix-turn-helix domain-containing protein n=1 Tax=Thermoactinospora rubra TaxID=1088767 RepID=UPI000A111775|nr:helix-turn-helix domain-containing protein [Thermoactinospora rubra]